MAVALTRTAPGPDARTTVLEVEGLTVYYGTPQGDMRACESVSFTLDRLAHMPERLPHGLCDLRTGAPLMTQPVADGTLVAIPRFPALPRLALGRSAEGPPAAGLRVEETDRGAVVETDLIRVEIARTGEIIRLTDKEVEREVLAPGKTGNRLLAFEDRPMVWDAWDVDIFYEDRCEQIRDADGFAVIETGPLRVGIKVAHRYRGCTIVQHIYLFHDSKRIDFDTWIDWHTSHILLKVAFPVNVLSPVATYDIQFGNSATPSGRPTATPPGTGRGLRAWVTNGPISAKGITASPC